MQEIKVRSITKLDKKHKVYDLSVDVNHNFYVGETQILTSNCDNLTTDAQKILRNVMEEYADHTRFILTANYRHRIIEPIESRCEIFDLAVDIRRFSVRIVNILNKENINITTNLSEFLKKRYPDFRRALNDLQKYCISGQTKLPTEQSGTFAASILEKILKNENMYEVRRYIIENEYTFNNDYQQLLKNLFEVCFTHTFKQDALKKLSLLHISEAMYRDNFVVDHEINFYSCLLQLNGVLFSK